MSANNVPNGPKEKAEEYVWDMCNRLLELGYTERGRAIMQQFCATDFLAGYRAALESLQNDIKEGVYIRYCEEVGEPYFDEALLLMYIQKELGE